MSEKIESFKDPTGLVTLPLSSVRVEDPEEEVFLLYSALSSRKPHDISSPSFPGLGSVDSHQDTLTVRFTIPPRPPPGNLEKSEAISTTHVSRSKKYDKRVKLASGAEAEERVLEIELLQDKTTLRSRKGDTGSVLWRVSVALGQAILGDLSSESSKSLFDPEKLKDCNVLELGAGTGLLSLIFAPWVRHYTVTDLDYLVPLIRKNVATNLPVVQKTVKPARHGATPLTKRPKHLKPERSGDDFSSRVTVESLNWVDFLRASPHMRQTSFKLTHADSPDVIVIADCVYNPSLLPALLTTINHYAAPERTCVLVAMELRAADVVREFLQLWTSSGTWEIWRVGSGLGDGKSDSNDDGWLGIDFAVWVGWKSVV